MDFIKPLPLSNGYDSILIIVDRKTKMAIFEPCKITMKTPKLALLFLKAVIAKHGTPLEVISDRGSKFTSAFWKQVMAALGSERKLSTAGHPQTDGQTERINQILKEFLRTFTNYLQDNWADLLPLAEFSYNNAYHSSIKTTPFYANYGFHPRYSIDAPEPGRDVEDHLTNIHETSLMVDDAIKEAIHNQAKYYNKKHIPGPTFKVDQQVWLNTSNLSTKRPMGKLDAKYIGPYIITKKINDVAFQLDLPKSFRIHNVFHISKLEPYKPNNIAGRKQPPPEPVMIEGEEEYEVEDILDSRITGRKYKTVQYLVKWTGYEDPSWEPGLYLANAQQLLRKFHKKYPNKPKYKED